MKALFTTLAIIGSFPSFATTISKFKSFQDALDETYQTGQTYELNQNGECELVYRKQPSPYLIAKIIKKEVAQLKMCKSELISHKIKNKLNGESCLVQKKYLLSHDDYETKFLKRGKVHMIYNSLTEDCVCRNVDEKRIFLSMSENIIRPWVIFEGPATKDLTVFKTISKNECSDLAATDEMKNLIEESYNEVERDLVDL